jgi:hypothetical protein
MTYFYRRQKNNETILAIDLKVKYQDELSTAHILKEDAIRNCISSNKTN